ncbi:hypothetical protein BDV18DRAFT_161154 [Aspergillus unguis]
MTQLPTPPASRQSSVLPDTELKQLDINDPTPDLVQSLDAHLEKYLYLLDKHQSLQNELSSKLSSGFLSLAHANYTCPPGRRFGADYYDERMKASRRITLQPSSIEKQESNAEHDRLPDTLAPSEQTFAINLATNVVEEELADTSDQSELTVSEEMTPGQWFSKKGKRDSDTAESTETPQDPADSSKSEPESDTKSDPVRQKSRTSDPIRWYGILVPPSLRNAQKSFIEAVESSITQLASVIVEMQVAEKEISRLRTQLERQ